jgi:hypothetical protein
LLFTERDRKAARAVRGARVAFLVVDRLGADDAPAAAALTERVEGL